MSSNAFAQDLAPPVGPGDALLLVDLQRDYMPGGALGVPGADAVLAPAGEAAALCAARDVPVFATRDWHPSDHCSFASEGGPRPPHCVAGTRGAQLAVRFDSAAPPHLVSKGTRADCECASGFAGTDLAKRLRAARVGRLLVAGVATEGCVLETVLDARRLGFDVVVLRDAVAAVDPVAGAQALARMMAAGARLVARTPACTPA